MEMGKVTAIIQAECKENPVKVQADGVIVIGMDRNSQRSRMVMVGGVNWRQVISDLLLAGMPKWVVIKALLFGVKAEVNKEEI